MVLQRMLDPGSLPVALYIPNQLCYIRIALAFVGLYYATTTNNCPVTAVSVWLLGVVLDWIDGLLARMLQQTSRFGAFLDICADNILRTTIWLAVVVVAVVNASNESDSSRPTMSLPSVAMVLLACWFICLEWITMVSTQLHASASTNSTTGMHWKMARENDPWIIRAYFHNNFVNLVGAFGIFGLFGANLLVYGSFHPVLYKSIPFYNILMTVAFAGRFFTMFVEVWLCSSAMSLIIESDNHDRQKQQKS